MSVSSSKQARACGMADVPEAPARWREACTGVRQLPRDIIRLARKSRSRLVLSPASPARVRTRQIIDSDIDAVARLLAEGFRRSTPQNWLEIFDRLAKHPTPAGLPKYGYLLESEGAPVGVILVVSSTVRTGDGSTKRCNLSSWYVSPAYRSYGHLFISRILKNKDVTFVNVSPASHTLPLIQAQGFSRYSDGQFFTVAAPFTFFGDAGVKVVAAGGALDSHIETFERELLLAHARYGCISLWCTTPDGAYPFVFRPRVVKGFLPCAQLIYCRDIEEFVRFARPIGRFLARRGKLIVMIDSNGRIPGLVGVYVNGVLPKYYKGPARPRLGDLAYTESALFGI